MAHNDPSEVINLLTAPDGYTAQSTIEGTPIARILLDVVNQPIFWQLKRTAHGSGAGYWDNVETIMSPGSRVIVRQGIVGFRFRAKTPQGSLPAGTLQSVVTVEAVK